MQPKKLVPLMPEFEGHNWCILCNPHSMCRCSRLRLQNKESIMDSRFKLKKNTLVHNFGLIWFCVGRKIELCPILYILCYIVFHMTRQSQPHRPLSGGPGLIYEVFEFIDHWLKCIQ